MGSEIIKEKLGMGKLHPQEKVKDHLWIPFLKIYKLFRTKYDHHKNMLQLL